ncbi:class II glutamine amidotransferase [Haliangium ochraceum]|uniref:Transglutaminase domain protein n=1 Tax=Haliangium ochraceum (strain DSM 14365 / JCM 11303 / SMP-2) TaxID=502025 RepID=D0LFZ1_HALO1|nr:class II glutamine amidotransferase [Haliangium ochraceum]ACY14593.1 transglutaminase domain protein [Haliangium ochraceum DSM 14365]
MSHLLAMSFDMLASPSIQLRSWADANANAAATGWGFAWYPGENLAAQVIKDPVSTGDTALTRVLRDWDRFRAVNFVCHIRGAAKRVTQQDTPPFARSYAGRDWVLAHNGDLERGYRDKLSLGEAPQFEPVGRTDSEWILCWLLGKIVASGARSLAGFGWPALHALLREINALGTANLVFSDGRDLVAFRDGTSFNELHVTRRKPPHGHTELSNQAVSVRFEGPFDHNNAMVLVATQPLSPNWRLLEPGEMLVSRRGAITWTSHPEQHATMTAPPPVAAVVQQGQTQVQTQAETQQGQGRENQAQPNAAPPTQDPPRIHSPETLISSAPLGLESRLLRVVHQTVYTYEQAVERSSHVFRLQPRHDVTQNLLAHSLRMTPTARSTRYHDVFDNHTVAVDIESPYTQLELVAESLVRVMKPNPLASPDRHSTIPLVWMPWQRQMMMPYLLPPELPETQLRELWDYAMSFVERQDYNLADILDDLNQTIYNDFAYQSGSTTLETTPFDVYVSRHGVCQDFANLFICIARLLGVPARYRVGYIFTGADYKNTIQSEASHAWVEVYLPQIGWRGFDPTNGCQSGMDHVGVAVGRNFRDATPTQGTLFKGGGPETLSASVRVEAVSDDEADDLLARWGSPAELAPAPGAPAQPAPAAQPAS